MAKKKPGVGHDNRMDWIILKILLTCPTFLCGLCVFCGESLPRLRPYTARMFLLDHPALILGNFAPFLVSEHRLVHFSGAELIAPLVAGWCGFCTYGEHQDVGAGVYAQQGGSRKSKNAREPVVDRSPSVS